MSVDAMNTSLVAYLKSKNSLYYGKVQELREVIKGWLSYIPQTFPHYTRHTIEHSEEIVLQLSKLLFVDEDPARPKVSLSGIEAYVLIAAAYLHDAGMVASDSEKTAIITSDSWRAWTQSNGGGAKRWAEIEALRRDASLADDALRNFLADVQTRFLIAEFIRSRHHLRAADVIEQHQSTLGRFAFDDLQLQQAISNVCVSHGFYVHELEDSQKYPERRDIRGEAINLRFMAILLRMGDLLDMSYDRACPLLSNAACPLPADSLAHWSQYRRITHRLTAPDRIEISAACETQEEHRVLQDWCQWLAEEAQNAGIIMAKAPRHKDWQPPHVSLKEPDQTILIKPSAQATYFPSKWILELDRDAVIDRLIYNVHEENIFFVLELIQNALDATRAQVYADLSKTGVRPPEYPNQIGEQYRRRYPISISLSMVDTKNELSGEVEKKQLLTIEDHGIGMDREVIERYFLQVGRSYYNSEEYRRTCEFTPVSRFGVGFLSVFSVSDHITVETYKNHSQRTTESICITLTGPRNYLLSEHGTRRIPGTRIEVRLREALAPGQLQSLISDHCRMVEFPIIVEELGSMRTVENEQAEQFVYELPDVTTESAKFVVRAFPIERPPIFGNLFVFAHQGASGERWDLWTWAQYRYHQEHPQASTPPFVEDLYCFHGMGGSDHSWYSGPGAGATRVDYRGTQRSSNLSRQRSARRRGRFSLDAASNEIVSARWEEILRDHLATSQAASDLGWKYKQNLVKSFPLPSFRKSLPATLQVHLKGGAQLISLDSLLNMEDLRTIVWPSQNDWSDAPQSKERDESVLSNTDIATISSDDLEYISTEHRIELFRNRRIVGLAQSLDGSIEICWRVCNDSRDWLLEKKLDRPVEIVGLPDDSIIGHRIHKTTENIYPHCVLNSKHPFVKWFLLVRDRSIAGDEFITQARYKTLLSLVRAPLEYSGHELGKLVNYIEKWIDIPGLDSELCPPRLSQSREMFSPARPAVHPNDKKQSQRRKSPTSKRASRRRPLTK